MTLKSSSFYVTIIYDDHEWQSHKKMMILRSCQGHLNIILGSCWDHFGVMLGSLRGQFGMTLGSFWDDSGVMFRSLWDHFWIMLGIIQKMFPNIFKYFTTHFRMIFTIMFHYVFSKKAEAGCYHNHKRLSPVWELQHQGSLDLILDQGSAVTINVYGSPGSSMNMFHSLLGKNVHETTPQQSFCIVCIMNIYIYINNFSPKIRW